MTDLVVRFASVASQALSITITGCTCALKARIGELSPPLPRHTGAACEIVRRGEGRRKHMLGVRAQAQRCQKPAHRSHGSMVAPARPIGAAGGHSPGKDAANCEPDGAIVERHLSLQLAV